MSGILVLQAEGMTAGQFYLHEILQHAGLPHEWRQADAPGDNWPVLLLVIGRRLSLDVRDRIAHHVAGGGLLLCLGAALGLEEVLGIASVSDAAEGWLERRQADHPILRGLEGPLHVFGGSTAVAGGADELASLHGRAALTWNRFGRGAAVFLGPDAPGSVLHIQQGIPVEKDGIPAPDGTAPIDEGILKVEDGLVLDWERDRQIIQVARGLSPGLWGQGIVLPDPLPPPDEPRPCPLFLDPVADGLRALLLKGLLALADAGGVQLPMLWYWPRGLPAVAHLSHDTDGNGPEPAEHLRAVCRECDIPSTWCILYPGGYSPAFYRRLLEEGFEIALHYDAMSGGPFTTWARENLHIQHQWLKDVAGIRSATSNKNHYTRWEGRLQFFHWCVEEGVRLDGSKGSSKTGGVGCLVGTCHPWFPLDDETGMPQRLDVLELPLMTQDLIVTAPEGYAPHLLDAACRHHGVAHFLYHPAHIGKPGVADSLCRLAQRVRDRGMEWWTSARVRDWEDARRAVQWQTGADGHLAPVLAADVEDATLLRLLPGNTTCPQGWQEVERYGFPFAQRIGRV